MELNLLNGGNPFEVEQILDLDVGYALTQYGFLPIQMDLFRGFDYVSFLPALLPDI
jgi:hypothetical protein